MRDEQGLWLWQLRLDGVPVGVSTRKYQRRLHAVNSGNSFHRLAEFCPDVHRIRRCCPTSFEETTVTMLLVDEATSIEARAISAWFGDRKVLDRVSLAMPARSVTATSTTRRGSSPTPAATSAWCSRNRSRSRRCRSTTTSPPVSSEKDDLVAECLIKAGLWKEVRDRLRQPGGALSGGQRQRLCIARALAVRPKVLLMDEPCSALDPTSTRRIEQTIEDLSGEVTIVIVTHNMQQAARVSAQCAFFLAEEGTPGVIVEAGPTRVIFDRPKDPRTADYVHGHFG